MAYEVRHGEVGFDIFEGGRVHSTGYSNRVHAWAAIRRANKAAEQLAYARATLRHVCDSFEDDGMSRATVAKVLGQEKDWRERP
jgi:hypothetical protein